MLRASACAVACLWLCAAVAGCSAAKAAGYDVRRTLPYETVDIYIDCGDAVLAAYEIEVQFDPSVARVSQVDAGTSAGFLDAPASHPSSYESGRIKLAAFQLNEREPSGRVHVARVHFRSVDVGHSLVVCRIVALADPAGKRIPGQILLVPDFLQFTY